MKPRLPLQLLSLALLAHAVPAAYADANTISINFTSGQSSTFDAGADWYDAAGNTGSAVIAANGDHDASYQGGGVGVALDYSSKNSWGFTDGITDNLLKGYLDDGSGITISLTGLLQQGFLSYDVTIYAASDNPPTETADFTSKTVNGVTYTANADGSAAVGDAAWGTAKEATVSANNSMTISGLAGDLTITSPTVTIFSDPNTDAARGSIAGIKVVNTYTGTRVAATLNNATDATWTQASLAGEVWTNSNEHANLTLTGDNTMTVSDGIVTDAIIASGSGSDPSSLTLNGGSIALNGPSILSAGTGVTLTINSALTAGKAVIDGAGTVAIGGQANLSGLTGNGNLAIAGGGKITIAGDAASSFTGTLSLADWNNAAASLESTNANWSFTGTALFNASNTGGTIAYSTLKNLDLLSRASHLLFDGGALTLAGGDNVSHKLTADVVTKTGSGEAIISNGSSVIGTLNIEGGVVSLNSSGYQIGVVNVADGGTLSLSIYGANMAGTPTINLSDGSGLDFRNSGASGATNTLTANIVITSSEAAKGVSIGGSYHGAGTVLAGTITGAGTLTIKNSLLDSNAFNPFTISAVIADTAGEQLHLVLDKPSSTVTFTSGNTYTGGTHIQAGTLSLTGYGTAGAGSVAIDANANIEFKRHMLWTNVTSGGGQFIVNSAASETVTVSRGSAGAWEDSFAGFTGTIDIRSGTLQLGLATEDAKENTVASLGSGKVKIASGAILALGSGVITLNNAMELADGARINVVDGTNSVAVNYTLAGTLKLAGTATINHSWDKSIKISGLLQDDASAHGKLVLQGNDNGVFILSGNSNTFSGGVELKNGDLYVEGNESLGTGTTTLSNGTALNFTREGGNSTSATIQANNATGTAALLKAKPAEARAAAAPVYTNIKVDATGIARSDANKKASVANAAIEVSSAYSISNAELNATSLTLNDAAALTLTDVTLGAGTTLSKATGATATLSLANTALILSSDNTTIGSDAASNPTTALVSFDMAGASVSGSFTLDLTGELLRNIAQQAGAPFTQIQITLANVTQWSVAESDFHLAESLGYLGPNAPTVDAQTGQVVVTVTFNEVIPEPATATLGLTALLGLMMRRRRRG